MSAAGRRTRVVWPLSASVACLLLMGMAGGTLVTRHEEAARGALQQARRQSVPLHTTMDWAEASTVRAVEEADRVVAEAAAIDRVLPLPADARQHLVRSKLALAEAKALRARGLPDAARTPAIEALASAYHVIMAAHTTTERYSNEATLRRWQQWAEDTRTWSRRTGRPAILVSKADRRLTLYVGGKVQRTFAADLGTNWVADKVQAGDAATPEGRYRIVARNGRSQFHKALLLDYPNAEDRLAFARARREGRLPAGASPGGLIEIHGEGGRESDWTRGCIALANAHMDLLFDLVPVGTPVTIVGALEAVMFGRRGPAPAGRSPGARP